MAAPSMSRAGYVVEITEAGANGAVSGDRWITGFLFHGATTGGDECTVKEGSGGLGSVLFCATISNGNEYASIALATPILAVGGFRCVTLDSGSLTVYMSPRLGNSS